jgi:hypothetical protein
MTVDTLLDSTVLLSKRFQQIRKSGLVYVDSTHFQYQEEVRAKTPYSVDSTE